MVPDAAAVGEDAPFRRPREGGGRHGEERHRLLTLPPEPRLGPGSRSGATEGDMKRNAAVQTCVHALGSRGPAFRRAPGRRRVVAGA